MPKELNRPKKSTQNKNRRNSQYDPKTTLRLEDSLVPIDRDNMKPLPRMMKQNPSLLTPKLVGLQEALDQ